MELDGLVKLLNAYKDLAIAKPVYVDLQGAKLRVSRRLQQFELKQESTVDIIGGEIEGTQAPNTIYIQPRVIGLLENGTKILLDDGKLEIVIESVNKENLTASAKVIRGGILKSGKGFNLTPHPLVNTELTERDRSIVMATRDFPFVRYALSFASLPSEVKQLRELAPKAHIAAKLERDLTDEQLYALAASSDSMWVCRGDMGVQLGFKGLTQFYLHINKLVSEHRLGCPIIMAGEVMDHTIDHNLPTRAELCHLADLKETHKYAGMVLSNETAFGSYPVQCVDFTKMIVG